MHAAPHIYEKYGNIISFDWGLRQCVVLSDLQTIKDALVKESDSFSGRARTPFDLSQKGYGM